MYLTKEEENILKGEEGWAKAKALEVVVRVGEALGAERLIEIKHAHVSGVSYENIGEAGLKFIEDLALSGAKFSVPTSVNPISFDLDYEGLPGLFKYRREDVDKQIRILRALYSMGAKPTLTCAPYYENHFLELDLKPGDSVAWGESSAVVYANSVLGLKTNREGGPIALLASVAGRTYYYGMHLDEERRPRTAYEIDWIVRDETEAGVLGALLAERHQSEGPPLLSGRIEGEGPLREFLASVGVEGDLAMVYLPGVSRDKEPEAIEKREEISREEVNSMLEELSPTGPVDVIYIGCPHLSLTEFEKLVHKIEKTETKVLLTVSPEVYASAKMRGLTEKLERKEVLVAKGTCLVVSSFWRLGLSVATNSYKAYFYLKRKGVRVYLARTQDLLKMVS
ncbi:MAG: aconitase X catalytic domain-containing protein [Acidilobaceae archaeon]